MNAFELEAIGEGFQAVATLQSTRISIAFAGNGDMHAIDLLAGYLKRVNEEATRRAVIEVQCDFRKLVFMNSSCFKAFVVWIDALKRAPPSYRISFLTDPDIQWQRRSLEALRRLAVNIVSIETESMS